MRRGGAGLALAMISLALVLTALAGCSSGSTDSDTTSGGGEVASAGGDKAAAPAQDSAAPAPGGAPQSRETQGRAILTDKSEVKTGSMTVRVTNVGRAATRAEDLALAAGGTVSAAQTDVDPEHPGRTTALVTLRVPNEAFTAFMRDLGRLGTLLAQNQSAVDVTSEVVDVESRVASQRASVARVRALLARATSIEDIVRIEAELSRRQADLESLEAQQKSLADRTAQATVTATFVGRAAAVPDDDSDLGLLAGLRSGWNAFTAAVVVALTVVGAALPFMALLAMIAVPAWLVWRSRRRQRTAPPAPAPAE